MIYSELVTAIKDYVETTEAKFVAHIDDFIKASEDTIFAAIQGPFFFKTSTSINTVDGTTTYFTAGGTIDILAVRISETPSDSDGPMKYLLRKDIDFISEAYPGSSAGPEKGIPKYYAVTSSTLVANETSVEIMLGPTPDNIYSTLVEYYGKATTDSITDGSSTKETWLSVAYPTLLLYGALIDAYVFQKGEADVIEYYKSGFDQGISLLKNLGENRQATDTFSDVGTQEAR